MDSTTKKDLNDKIKKNLLDLNYNKYLQYYTTTIIILFTFFIGLTLAFITKQIDYNNISQMILTAFISAIILSVLVILMLNFRSHIKNIPEEVKKLKI